jgi:hypothetical protein
MFLVTVSTVNGPVLFHAKSLEEDKGIKGNLIAIGITDFPVRWGENRTFMTNVFSFRASDLISYMVGHFLDDGPQDILVLPPETPAPGAASPVPDPHASANPSFPKKRKS